MGNIRFFMMVGLLLLCGLLVLALNSWAQERAPILEKIAKAYGIDSWNQIQAIHYTFSAEIPGGFKHSHAWEWEPKTGKISYEGKDKDGKPVEVTYMQPELGSQSDMVKNKVDPSFVNDNYWLLFPFHAYWDKSATVTDQGMKKLPIGNGSARLVSVKYPVEAGGYTPGDTWDLYVGKDYRVQAMVFHLGREKNAGVTATWVGYKKAGPLLFSTEHRAIADGKPLRISITNVAVRLVGSDKWVDAQ